MNTNLKSYEQRAIAAHSWISFRPDERGKQYISDCETELNELLSTVPVETHGWVTDKYKKLMSHHISSLSRTASSAITGGSGFNVRRQEKMRNWERSSYDNWRSWVKNITKKLNRAEKPDLDTQVEEKENLIEELKETHKMMVASNKVIRDKKLTLEEKKEELSNLGNTDENIAEILKGGSWWGLGYPTFSLTNSLARIKGHEETLEKLKRRVSARSEEQQEKVINGVKFVKNVVDNRLEAHFSGKPERETINVLKSNGFRWTPSKNCWQSYLTINHHKLNEVLEHIKSLQNDSIGA
jgi:hypothetical protein